MSKPKIYFANKIKKQSRDNYGLTVDSDDYFNDDNKYKSSYYNQKHNNIFFREEEKYIVMGALTIGCDHGCYHSNKHGTDDSSYSEQHQDYLYGCSGGSDNCNDVKAKTLERCLNQIKNSDIVIATINKDYDCYGTIAEVSYAYGLGKYIMIIFDEMENKNNKELWFICKMALEKEIPKEWLKIIFEINKVKKTYSSYNQYKQYMFNNVFESPSKSFNEDENIYLNVPFGEKEEAKKLKAKWDYKLRKWYAPDKTYSELLQKYK